MNGLRVEAHQSMFIIDGGADADLPAGSGGPVLAGPEAIFVAGRVEFDAPTTFRIGRPGEQGELVQAYTGEIATPLHVLRVVTVEQEVLLEVPVLATSTTLSIYLTDLEEPDEVFVALHSLTAPGAP